MGIPLLTGCLGLEVTKEYKKGQKIGPDLYTDEDNFIKTKER